jgi:hypothetical protein
MLRATGVTRAALKTCRRTTWVFATAGDANAAAPIRAADSNITLVILVSVGLMLKEKRTTFSPPHM